MAISHPLSWVPVEHEKVFLVILILANVLVTVGIGIADHHLRTEVTPLGIASFELSGDSASAAQALEAWGETGRAYAAFSLGLDYLYLLLYSALSAFIAGLIGRKLEGQFSRISKLSVWFAWAFVFAAIFDAMENTVLIAVVVGASDELWVRLGFAFASVKFTLAGLGVVYLLVGGGLCLLSRGSRTGSGH